jgi:hypothetical protein
MSEPSSRTAGLVPTSEPVQQASVSGFRAVSLRDVRKRRACGTQDEANAFLKAGDYNGSGHGTWHVVC